MCVLRNIMSQPYNSIQGYKNKKVTKTSTVVFYRTRVYQMQPRNGQNWHSSVEKYVHHNRETA